MAVKKAKKKPVAELGYRQWRIILVYSGTEAFVKIIKSLGIRRQVFNLLIRDLLRTAEDWLKRQKKNGENPFLHDGGQQTYELSAQFIVPPDSVKRLRQLLVNCGEAIKLEHFQLAQRQSDISADEVRQMAEVNFTPCATHRFNWNEWYKLAELARYTKDQGVMDLVREYQREARSIDDFDG